MDNGQRLCRALQGFADGGILTQGCPGLVSCPFRANSIADPTDLTDPAPCNGTFRHRKGKRQSQPGQLRYFGSHAIPSVKAATL